MVTSNPAWFRLAQPTAGSYNNSLRSIRLTDDLPFPILLHQVEEVGEIRTEEALFFQDRAGHSANDFDGGND